MTLVKIIIHRDSILQNILIIWIQNILPYNDTHNMLQLAMHIGRMKLLFLYVALIQRLTNNSDGLVVVINEDFDLKYKLIRESLSECKHNSLS